MLIPTHWSVVLGRAIGTEAQFELVYVERPKLKHSGRLVVSGTDFVVTAIGGHGGDAMQGLGGDTIGRVVIRWIQIISSRLELHKHSTAARVSFRRARSHGNVSQAMDRLYFDEHNQNKQTQSWQSRQQ